MLRTVLFGLAAWAIVSVPVAIILGRLMSVGAASTRLDDSFVEVDSGQVHEAA